MPLALARLAVESHQALGEQVVAQPVAAVPVVRRRAERQVDEAEILIRRDQRPDVRVARVLPGVVLPGLVTVFPRLRNRVEGPAQFAGHRIEAADVSGRSVGVVRGVRYRRAHDHRVAADHDRRTHGVGAAPPDLAPQALGQVDRPAVAETADRFAGERIDRQQPGVAGAVEQPRRHFLAVVAGGSAGPVAGAAMNEAEVRGPARVVGLRVVDPFRLTGRRIERGDLAQAGRGVEAVADLDRRHLVAAGLHAAAAQPAILRHAIVVGRRPAPGNLELVDVARIDLVERCVALPALVAGGHRPLAVLCRCRNGGSDQAESRRQDSQPRSRVHSTPPARSLTR